MQNISKIDILIDIINYISYTKNYVFTAVHKSNLILKMLILLGKIVYSIN